MSQNITTTYLYDVSPLRSAKTDVVWIPEDFGKHPVVIACSILQADPLIPVGYEMGQPQSDSLFHHTPLILYGIEIQEIWRPFQYLELFIMFLKLMF